MNPHLLLQLGGIGLAFFFTYFYFKHRELDMERRRANTDYSNKASIILQGVLILGIMVSVYSIPKAAIDGQDFCEVVMVNETDITGGNQTDKTFDYDRVCFDNPSNTSVNLFTRILWILRGIGFYILVYFLFKIWQARKEIAKEMRSRFG